MATKEGPRKLKRFVVRRNCEYSTLVEAMTLEEAIKIASTDPIENWEASWSEIEAEAE